MLLRKRRLQIATTVKRKSVYVRQGPYSVGRKHNSQNWQPLGQTLALDLR